MISAKDWRIGNWYQWYADGFYYEYQVEAKDFCNGNMENYEPIPLTQEWLQRFGFIKKISASYATGDRVEFNTWSKEELTYNSIQDSWWFNGRILKFQPRYVHTLQNLTHSLTNQELTIG